jgi:hypothetical protein
VRFRPPSPGTFRISPCGIQRTALRNGFNLVASRTRCDGNGTRAELTDQEVGPRKFAKSASFVLAPDEYRLEPRARLWAGEADVEGGVAKRIRDESLCGHEAQSVALDRGEPLASRVASSAMRGPRSSALGSMRLVAPSSLNLFPSSPLVRSGSSSAIERRTDRQEPEPTSRNRVSLPHTLRARRPRTRRRKRWLPAACPADVPARYQLREVCKAWVDGRRRPRAAPPHICCFRRA